MGMGKRFMIFVLLCVFGLAVWEMVQTRASSVNVDSGEFAVGAAADPEEVDVGLFTRVCNQCEVDGKVQICEEGNANVGALCIGGCSSARHDKDWCWTGYKTWGLCRCPLTPEQKAELEAEREAAKKK